VIVTYGPEHIPLVWDQVEPHLKRAVDRGSIYSLEDIYDHLRNNRMQLWTWNRPDTRAAMTTGIIDGDCYLITAGGSHLSEWASEFKIVEKWAIDIGCGSIKIHGRKGWAKILGFDIVGKDELGLYILEKKLWDHQAQALPDQVAI
jgi:hypothetical protein